LPFGDEAMPIGFFSTGPVMTTPAGRGSGGRFSSSPGKDRVPRLQALACGPRGDVRNSCPFSCNNRGMAATTLWSILMSGCRRRC